MNATLPDKRPSLGRGVPPRRIRAIRAPRKERDVAICRVEVAFDPHATAQVSCRKPCGRLVSPTPTLNFLLRALERVLDCNRWPEAASTIPMLLADYQIENRPIAGCIRSHRRVELAGSGRNSSSTRKIPRRRTCRMRKLPYRTGSRLARLWRMDHPRRSSCRRSTQHHTGQPDRRVER